MQILLSVTGGEPTEQKRFGDHLAHAARYARTDELLSVVRVTWAQAPYDLLGQHCQIEGAQIRGSIDPVPDIYFGGAFAPAGPVAARHADVHLTWGEPRSQPASRSGCAPCTAPVGSHQEVADRREEYHDLGIDEFIFSGYPHVEQTYWFAEGVMPILRAKGIYGPRARERRLVRSA